MDLELIVAAAAVFISVVSLGTSIYFSKSAQEHNRKSVLPIPYLDRSDYEDQLHLRLYNKGTGPMIVTSLRASHPLRGDGHVIDLIPPSPPDFSFADFARFTEPRTIRPGEYNDLLAATFDDSDPDTIAYRDELRVFLKDLTVRCEYTDVYASRLSPYEVGCEWFGRHFESG